MAAVATRSANSSNPNSSKSSPVVAKKNIPKKDDPVRKEPLQAEPSKQDTPQPVPVATIKVDNPLEDPKLPIATVQPLAPPPKPAPTNPATNPAETPDYFSAGHNNSHFSLEPNPFEHSFANPAETPGKFVGALPSVASLTSPAPLGIGGTPGWQGSLRSGPLSPAMLAGPTGGPGYFDEGFRGSFPTPNESSLRTGLTPGGGGSMFPAPSPNSQTLFQTLQNGGATPGTLDFHRTAMAAAARSKGDTNGQAMGPTGQGIDKSDYRPTQQPTTDPFANHSESDAVNSLYMLAQTGNRNANNQFAMPNPPHMNNNVAPMQHRMGSMSQDTSPTNQRGTKRSIGSIESNNYGDGSDGSMEDKPATKAKGKKPSVGKNGQAANGRRKVDDTPGKAPANKRTKSNGANAMNMQMNMDMQMQMNMDMDDDSDEGDIKDELSDTHPSGRKMTDEEKRKNFLERNRVAALKCRQRKKQWLANLQTKVEIFTQENDALSQQCGQLREEIVQLKTLLLQHKDCAVSHQQGLGGNNMAQVMGNFDPQNPYGMPGMPHPAMMQMQPGPGMQRR